MPNGRAKGNAFERLVAKKLCAALGATSKEIYRTPLSGGHPYVGGGDLQIAERLREVFPWCVECKHSKSFNAAHLFCPTEQLNKWAAQALKAARKENRPALLIMQGDGRRGSIFVAKNAAGGIRYPIPAYPGEMYVTLSSACWVVVTLDRFLQILSRENTRSNKGQY